MTTFILGAVCVVLGCLVGTFMPTISYEYSKYLAIAIMAAFDSSIGAFAAKTQSKYDYKIFFSGFFTNAIIAIVFTMIGENLDVDIYLAAIFVFVFRIFNNLSVIRRYAIEKFIENSNNKNKKNKKQGK